MVTTNHFSNFQNEIPNTFKMKAFLNTFTENTFKMKAFKAYLCTLTLFKMKDYLYLPLWVSKFLGLLSSVFLLSLKGYLRKSSIQGRFRVCRKEVFFCSRPSCPQMSTTNLQTSTGVYRCLRPFIIRQLVTNRYISVTRHHEGLQIVTNRRELCRFKYQLRQR
jgi:hypothetical protein